MSESSTPPRPFTVTAVILAGGESRRMGGKDKGLIPFCGSPMAKWVLNALAPQVDSVLVSANRNQERYSALGVTVIPDSVSAHGPLAGIASALKVIKTDYLVVAPCDGPYLPRDLVTRLYHALHVKDRPLACVHDGNRLQPVYLLVHRRVLPALLTHLEHGQYKTKDWVRSLDPAVADFSDCPDAFENINSPADLSRLETRFARIAGRA